MNTYIIDCKTSSGGCLMVVVANSQEEAEEMAKSRLQERDYIACTRIVTSEEQHIAYTLGYDW